MDPDTALLALGEAMSLDPENIDTFAITADIHISRKDMDEADALINQAIELCKGRRTPELAVLQMKKADICHALGNRAEELQWVEQASLSNRNDGEIAARLADLAEEVEDWEMALKALRNISLLKTECPISKAETFFRQGRIAHIQGDPKRAVLYVKKALQEEPGHEAAKEWLDRNA
jgi:tetratricopeptide (TPR) repeat protein